MDDPRKLPPQHQSRPGHSRQTNPVPETDYPDHRSGFKLQGRRALITGGDSGIGQTVALLFARKGADKCIVYSEEHDGTQDTLSRIEQIGSRGMASYSAEHVKDFDSNTLIKRAWEPKEVAPCFFFWPAAIHPT